MDSQINSIDILGVRVDEVSMDQAVSQIEDWTLGSGKHYVVTPNIEFIMAAQKDQDFKEILNKADLSIPDSARLGWAKKMVEEKNFLKKLLIFPLFLIPNFFDFPVTTGTGLIYSLGEGFSKGADKRVVTIGLLGGKNGVAKKCAECLIKKYPGFKVAFAQDGPEVDMEGKIEDGSWKMGVKDGSWKMDILFVAFGALKQEKWITKNLPDIPVKVAIGVGGAFDYISGYIPRAPGIMRNLGLEWLFRLIIQPWRIKRFRALVKFVFSVW